LYLVNTYYDGVIGPLVSVWLTLAILGFCLLNQTVARRNCVTV
jgi:hypothetical protein